MQELVALRKDKNYRFEAVDCRFEKMIQAATIGLGSLGDRTGKEFEQVFS